MRKQSEPLKAAVVAVVLLLGAVVAFLLGGLVIALRLLFDDFSLQGAVTAVGQLPRRRVASTARCSTWSAPVVCFGSLIAMVTRYSTVSAPGWRPRAVEQGPEWMARTRPRASSAARRALARLVLDLGLAVAPAAPPRRPGRADRREQRRADELTSGRGRPAARLFLCLLVVAALGTVPALLQAVEAEDVSALLVPCILAVAVTFGLLCAGWYWIRRGSRDPDDTRLGRAMLAGGVWAAIAIVPAVMWPAPSPSSRPRPAPRARWSR